MENSREAPKNVQHNNIQNAILFEAINLAIHLDPESSIVGSAAVLLGRFILSKETNVRYLGLDAMAHLAACSDSLEPIKKHQATIILSLRDRDISVRRRALDLLYSMCDTSNAKIIVAELLKYLQIADYGLREEMVLKIAILTEKFATEYEWYVDTSESLASSFVHGSVMFLGSLLDGPVLELISLAGDHVADEVWYRVVQIVTNTEDLQVITAPQQRCSHTSPISDTHISSPSLTPLKSSSVTSRRPQRTRSSSSLPPTFSASLATSSPTILAAAQSSSSRRFTPKSISARRQLARSCCPPTSNG